MITCMLPPPSTKASHDPISLVTSSWLPMLKLLSGLSKLRESLTIWRILRTRVCLSNPSLLSHSLFSFSLFSTLKISSFPFFNHFSILFSLDATLENAYKVRLSAVFDDQIRKAENDIQIQTQVIMDGLKRVESRLKRLADGSMSPRSSESISPRSRQTDWECRSSECSAVSLHPSLSSPSGLASRLQELSLSFRKSQKAYMTKLTNLKAYVLLFPSFFLER